jgi:4-diphosphocytidyl-2-C-methyl-D-erythritol kinase
MLELDRFAPAKVNLFLHVGALGEDGYHPLSSLVTFASVGDVVRLKRTGEAMEFRITGPFADQLSGEGDNLVTRARDLLLARMAPLGGGLRLTLDKRLPIASGVGGGSADAAATLSLIAEVLGPELGEVDSATLMEIAGQLGSDVPVCLWDRAMLAEGRGDVCDYPPMFPDLDAVLVNPLKPSPTGPVYRAYDEAGAPGDAEAPDWPDQPMETVDDVVRFLASCRNDLEAPAILLQPAIADVLKVLNARPEVLFARMSGSGATCFAICANAKDRRDLAFALGALHPAWWVADCLLKGFSPDPAQM